MKKIFLLTLLIFCTLFLSSVLAAPAQWGIAINDDTLECAGYWAGDEFSYYDLPSGWESYSPEYEDGYQYIETPYGTCIFETLSENKCCSDLGLTYVTDQIGVDETYEEVVGDPLFLIATPILLICCFILIIIFLIFLIVFLKKKNRSK